MSPGKNQAVESVGRSRRRHAQRFAASVLLRSRLRRQLGRREDGNRCARIGLPNGNCILLPWDRAPGYDACMDSPTTLTTNQPDELAQVPPADRVRIISTPGVCGGRPRIVRQKLQQRSADVTDDPVPPR